MIKLWKIKDGISIKITWALLLYLSSLTQQFCTRFDNNEINISGAQNGMMWSVGHLS